MGLLYDSKALDAAWELVKGWTAAEREALRRAVPTLGLKAPIRNTTAQAIAREIVALARAGLARRKLLNAKREDETVFLSEVEEIADSGINPAERLLAKYHGEWKRDLTRAFTEVRLLEFPRHANAGLPAGRGGYLVMVHLHSWLRSCVSAAA